MTPNKQFATASSLLMEACALRAEATDPDNAHVSVELMLRVIQMENQAKALLNEAFGSPIPLDPSDNDTI